MAFGQDLPMSFMAALKAAERILGSDSELVRRGVVSAEAEQIVTACYRKATGKALSRVGLFSRIGDRYPEVAGRELLIMAAARAQGKPLQHLTGYQAFLDHEYEVGPDVLVPRPETESLVVAAVDELRRAFGAALRNGLEIGLGSGAISIELLHAFPALRIRASELTEGARAIARRNAERLTVADRLEILPAESREVWESFAKAAPARVAQFVISNPPYLTHGDGIEADVLKHEPATALFAPEGDPLYFYRRIAEGASAFLQPGGLIFVELPHERAREIRALFERLSFSPTILHDLNGRERVLHAKVGS